MRCRSVVLAALLLCAVPVGAQEPVGLLEDPAGDVAMQAAGAPLTSPVERHGAVDLRALQWQEGPEGFAVILTVADVRPPPGGTPFDSVRYFIGFHLDETPYGLYIDRYISLGQTVHHVAYVGPLVEENGYRYVDQASSVEITIDEAASTLTGTFPREALTDAEGAPAALGDVLSGFFVEAGGSLLFGENGPLYSVRDRMPDDGTGGVYDVVFGTLQDGDARLASPAPFRLSNGGATSLIFDVEALNLGEKQAFRLAAEGVPEGWTVSLPFERMVVDEAESRNFPVLVTTPSGHQHGGAKSFMLSLTGERDNGDVGRVELGVKYTTIPQPAGHHPTLYLHSHRPWGSAVVPEVDEVLPGFLFPPPQGYLNAAAPEDDPIDTQEPVTSYMSLIPGPGWFSWQYPLLPSLGMGLDFDTKELAMLSLPVSYDYVAQGVQLSASIHYDSPTESFAIANSMPQDPVSFGPNQQYTFELTFPIERDADFIPFDPDARLYLLIDMQGLFVGPNVGPGSVPAIAPGGTLELPLLEYHDPVDRFYRAVESLTFDTEYIERPVNPDKTVVFEARLRNSGTQAEPVQLNLTGLNAEWARILGDPRFELGVGQERTIAVAVVVPAGTPGGALADLVLQAVSERDAFRRAIIDIIAIVDEGADHSDESAKVDALDKKLQDGKKSPGFELAAVGLGLLAVALVLRRRR